MTAFFMIAETPAGSTRWSLRVPITHDLYHHFDQMRSFYDGLASGRIYPRWQADVNLGFGAPTFVFYPPAIYYLTSAFYAVTGDWMTALFGTLLAATIASGAAFYHLARRFFGRTSALVAMVIYIVSPYRLVDIYQRGAIAELLAFVWMPLVLLFADRLIDRGDGEADLATRESTARLVALLALSYAAFVWSHPPTAYQFALVLAAYVVCRCWLNGSWKRLVPIGSGLLLAVILAGAYLLPAALERGHVRSDAIEAQDPYHSGYVFGSPDRYAGDAADFNRLIDLLWLMAIAALVLAGLLVAFKTIREWGFMKRARAIAPLSRIIALVLAGGIACFLMVAPSRSVGSLIPEIGIGMFPWRLLVVTTLVTSLLAGWLFNSARDRSAGLPAAGVPFFRIACAGLCILMGGAAVAVAVKKVIWPYRGSPAFVAEPGHLNYALSPRTALCDINSLPRVDGAAMAGGGGVSIEEWLPERRMIRVSGANPDRLIIRTFRLPGWSATVDGEPVPLLNGRTIEFAGGNAASALLPVGGRTTDPSRSCELGDIGIPVPPGEHLIALEYTLTPVKQIGSLMTFLAAAVICLLLFLSRAAPRPSQ
jgi:hypothetical protein